MYDALDLTERFASSPVSMRSVGITSHAGTSGIAPTTSAARYATTMAHAVRARTEIVCTIMPFEPDAQQREVRPDHDRQPISDDDQADAPQPTD